MGLPKRIAKSAPKSDFFSSLLGGQAFDLVLTCFALERLSECLALQACALLPLVRFCRRHCAGVIPMRCLKARWKAASD